MYTALIIPADELPLLKLRFEPKYPSVIAHHITLAFGVKSFPAEELSPRSVKIVGYVDSGDGLEALVVKVDNNLHRPDGGIYHITWSLDPEKYKPKDSNELLRTTKWKVIVPIYLSDIIPTLIK